MLHGSETTVRNARRLRKEMSLPERLLWNLLKTRPNGIKFRRQHPAGAYIADFYCHEFRLIVEVDGIAHDMGARPTADERRDVWFRERNFNLVRIPAADVLRDPHAVADALVELCRVEQSPSAFRAATSPAGRVSPGVTY